MPALANPKHEQFARNVANGMGIADAYHAAGYPLSPSAASQLHARAEVKARINEFIAERERSLDDEEDVEDAALLDGFDTSPEGLIKELFKNLRRAQRENNITGANKAVELIADLRGYLKKGAGDALNSPAAKSDPAAPPSPKIAIGDLKDAVGAISEQVRRITQGGVK